MLKPKLTVTKHAKKTRTNTGKLKRKSLSDKQFKLKLSNTYAKKLSKFNLEYNPREETCQLHKL